MDFKKLLKQPEYDFLRTNEHLGRQYLSPDARR